MSIKRELFSSIVLPLLLIIIVVGCVIYINPGFPNFVRGWTTYRDKEVPFVFDYPNSWQFEKKVEHPNQQLPTPSLSIGLTAIRKADNQKILKIGLWDGPVLDIAWPCSTRRDGNKDCSYLDSQLADYFFRYQSGYWMSQNGQGGQYTVTLYEHDRMTEDTAAQIIQSLRRP